MSKISAACSHVRLPANARMITCWYVMARSTAAAANVISTSWVADGRALRRSKSGHFTCSRERTDHVLPTPAASGLDQAPESAVCGRWVRRRAVLLVPFSGVDGGPGHLVGLLNHLLLRSIF